MRRKAIFSSYSQYVFNINYGTLVFIWTDYIRFFRDISPNPKKSCKIL